MIWVNLVVHVSEVLIPLKIFCYPTVLVTYTDLLIDYLTKEDFKDSNLNFLVYLKIFLFFQIIFETV